MSLLDLSNAGNNFPPAHHSVFQLLLDFVQCILSPSLLHLLFCSPASLVRVEGLHSLSHVCSQAHQQTASQCVVAWDLWGLTGIREMKLNSHCHNIFTSHLHIHILKSDVHFIWVKTEAKHLLLMLPGRKPHTGSRNRHQMCVITCSLFAIWHKSTYQGTSFSALAHSLKWH